MMPWIITSLVLGCILHGFTYAASPEDDDLQNFVMLVFLWPLRILSRCVTLLCTPLFRAVK